MYYEGTFDIGMKAGYRLVVSQDNDAENPTEWGGHVEEGDDIYRRWARGDVYGVILEKYTRYVNVDDPSDLYGRWSEAESLWGCYLDKAYDAWHVATEHGWAGTLKR